MASALALALLAALASAAEDWPDRPEPIPHTGAPWPEPAARALAAPDPELQRLSARLASAATEQLAAARRTLRRPAPACTASTALVRYLQAQRTLGQSAGCLDLVERCRVARGEGAQGLERILYEGARCASTDDEFARAYGFYDEATRPAHAASPDFEGIVYSFARFARFTQYEGQARAILRRNPAWSEAEQDLAFASLDYLGLGDTPLAEPARIEALVLSWIESPDGVLAPLAVAAWARHLAWNRYRTLEAARFLERHVGALSEPETWISIAYFSLYRQRAPSFLLARPVYDASIPALHPAAWMPVEQNTLDYTQIEASVCAGRLLEGAARTEALVLRTAWAAGRVSLDEAVATAETLARAQPGRADLLSFLGSLYELAGRDAEAADRYWRAHLACPYYNRAHWGLVSFERRRRNRSFDDYATLLSRVEAALAAEPPPPELPLYVRNLATLPPEGRRRVLFALGLWTPYVGFLHRGGASVYVKQAFELLSETPGLERLRDRRIQGPGFEEDNRLWDDVRGVASGSQVVVDYGEMMEAPFGAYNLVAHEVAHQFHRLLPEALQACIGRLYRGAQDRGVFPDPYAATNEYEYFAQGAGYYLTPPDAPPRFGLNVRWLIDNDRDLYRLFEGVRSAGDVGAIACPLP